MRLCREHRAPRFADCTQRRRDMTPRRSAGAAAAYRRSLACRPRNGDLHAASAVSVLRSGHALRAAAEAGWRSLSVRSALPARPIRFHRRALGMRFAVSLCRPSDPDRGARLCQLCTAAHSPPARVRMGREFPSKAGAAAVLYYAPVPDMIWRAKQRWRRLHNNPEHPTTNGRRGAVLHRHAHWRGCIRNRRSTTSRAGLRGRISSSTGSPSPRSRSCGNNGDIPRFLANGECPHFASTAGFGRCPERRTCTSKVARRPRARAHESDRSKCRSPPPCRTPRRPQTASTRCATRSRYPPARGNAAPSPRSRSRCSPCARAVLRDGAIAASPRRPRAPR